MADEAFEPPAPRRINLGDLAILVAAAAVACALLVEMFRVDGNGMMWLGTMPAGYRLGCEAVTILLPMAAGLLVAGWRGPLPKWRRMLQRPGTLACMAFLSAFGWDLTIATGRFLLGIYTGRFCFYPPTNITYIMLCGVTGGEVVVAVWVTMSLLGRWRPEPDWLDRSGRILGVGAIGASVVTGFYV